MAFGVWMVKKTCDFGLSNVNMSMYVEINSTKNAKIRDLVCKMWLQICKDTYCETGSHLLSIWVLPFLKITPEQPISFIKWLMLEMCKKKSLSPCQSLVLVICHLPYSNCMFQKVHCSQWPVLSGVWNTLLSYRFLLIHLHYYNQYYDRWLIQH